MCADQLTADVKVFGPQRWVYCKQHVRPHMTGWCTVSPDQKLPLDADNQKDAYDEARRKGLKIYGE